MYISDNPQLSIKFSGLFRVSLVQKQWPKVAPPLYPRKQHSTQAAHTQPKETSCLMSPFHCAKIGFLTIPDAPKTLRMYMATNWCHPHCSHNHFSCPVLQESSNWASHHCRTSPDVITVDAKKEQMSCQGTLKHLIMMTWLRDANNHNALIK